MVLCVDASPMSIHDNVEMAMARLYQYYGKFDFWRVFRENCVILQVNINLKEKYYGESGKSCFV